MTSNRAAAAPGKPPHHIVDEREVARLPPISVNGYRPASAIHCTKRNRLMSGRPAGPYTVKRSTVTSRPWWPKRATMLRAFFEGCMGERACCAPRERNRREQPWARGRARTASNARC